MKKGGDCCWTLTFAISFLLTSEASKEIYTQTIDLLLLSVN